MELEKSAMESAVLQYTSVETDGGDALRPTAECREIAMRRALRFVPWGLISVVALGGALFGYFVYSPAPEVPRLSGTLTKGTIEVGGLKRTYLTHVPRGLAKGAPLVVVMHGSDENGARIRIETGYGFERIADERGFAVVYPDGYEGYWNACNIVGDYSANKLNIDDVGFLTGVVDTLITEIGVDRDHVFATGVSRGGHMAFRLALEAPSWFRAVATVSANVPTPENFKCKPAGQGTSSVMIMNGTMDPLNPFDGGEVKLFGLVHRARQGPVVAGVRPIFCRPQPHGRHACNEPDPDGRRSSRRAGALAQRLQSRGGTRCHPRRWTWHPSAIPAPSAIVRPVAQGTERTGSDLGLLRATAANN